VAAAVARQQLLEAAAARLGTDADRLSTISGTVVDAAGNAIPYGELASDAASQVVKQVGVTLRPREEYRVIGTGRKRTDARAAVTGQKDFPTWTSRGPSPRWSAARRRTVAARSGCATASRS
jgi:isoquinoline 1-oxidoreductase beta subunit